MFTDTCACFFSEQYLYNHSRDNFGTFLPTSEGITEEVDYNDDQVTLLCDHLNCVGGILPPNECYASCITNELACWLCVLFQAPQPVIVIFVSVLYWIVALALWYLFDWLFKNWASISECRLFISLSAFKGFYSRSLKVYPARRSAFTTVKLLSF